ncbi:MAG: hypothetical protein JWR18_4111 [Segetibacter sp.]|nr:hypothetical protein [Segetibacter sp.]
MVYLRSIYLVIDETSYKIGLIKFSLDKMVEECDATIFNRSTTAGSKKLLFITRKWVMTNYKNMLRKIPFTLLFLLPFIYGCGSLTAVHSYATKSVDALNRINEIGYTYKDYCRKDCELQQLRKGEITQNFRCTCEAPAAAADEALQKIHQTITAYLQAVAALSNNSDFTYDVSGLTEAVQKSPLLGLTDKQVAVSTKAGNFIATAATTFYRKKKLKQYLGEADSIFRELTETFIYLIDNRLRAQLKFEYNAQVPNLKQLLDDTNDRAVKQMLIKSYLDEKAWYEKHNRLIDTYVALLKSVQKGYHDLYIHRSNLKDDNIKSIIQNYAKDLQYIMASTNNK